MTQGRGYFKQTFERYEETLANIAQKVIEEARKTMSDDEVDGLIRLKNKKRREPPKGQLFARKPSDQDRGRCACRHPAFAAITRSSRGHQK